MNLVDRLTEAIEESNRLKAEELKLQRERNEYLKKRRNKNGPPIMENVVYR